MLPSLCLIMVDLNKPSQLQKFFVQFGWFYRDLLLLVCACQINPKLLRPLAVNCEILSLEFQPQGLQ